jgi:hypothetical protein
MGGEHWLTGWAIAISTMIGSDHLAHSIDSAKRGLDFSSVPGESAMSWLGGKASCRCAGRIGTSR